MEVNSVEYAPLTQRASKAAHMEHINPNESNQKRQTRTQPHRDPNEQSDDMNPKKGKKEEVLSQPKATVSVKKNKVVTAQPGQDETRQETEKPDVRFLNYTPTTILNPHSKSRGGVGRSDRESNLLCAFPARFGRAVTAWCACT